MTKRHDNLFVYDDDDDKQWTNDTAGRLLSALQMKIFFTYSVLGLFSQI